MTKFKSLIKSEKNVCSKISDIVSSLCEYIRYAKMEELSENNTISKETWIKYGSLKNPTKFFLPREQAKLVGNFLITSNSSVDFANRLRMIYRKKEIGDWESITPLNPATLRAIEDFAKDEKINLDSAWWDIK